MIEQRASDADREHAAERLRRAGGDGRLTLDELGDRVQQAYGARTRGELEVLVGDVEEAGAFPAAPSGSSGAVVRPGEGGARWVVAVMSGAARTGRWRVGSRCTVLNVMGGAELDFNDAELAAENVEVTVFSIMGGTDIYVPDDLRVEISDIGIMGGNDVERSTTEGSRDGPVVRLRLVSIMGGANVRRGPKRGWRARRKQRRLDERSDAQARSRP